MTSGEEARDLSLLRSQRCYDEVKNWKSAWRKEATQRVKGLPIAIRTQGLMVVVATLMREERAHSRRLGEALAAWLIVAAPINPLQRTDTKSTSPRQLLEACRTLSRAEYLALESEAVLFFDQIKLYADAWASKG